MKFKDQVLNLLSQNYVLILILLLASFLRLYRLDLLPLFGDELDVGYHALSLATTARDYYGQLLPTYIHSLAEWRAPLLMYFTAPFTYLFGLSQFSVRLFPALMGIANVFLLYSLVLKTSSKKSLALLSALVLAISPWHLHYSRAAFEVTLLLTLLLSGTLSFLARRFSLSAFLFALSLYTYNTANIFLPLWLVFLFLSQFKALKKDFRQLLLPALVFLALSLPILLSILKGEAATRFQSISIFSNPQAHDELISKRTTGLAPAKERIFHNKATVWGRQFAENYLTALSPEFLFLKGGPNPRHSVPGFGVLYLIFAPFFLWGVFRLLLLKDKNFSRLVMAWLLLAPIPSSLTVGGGTHSTRLFLLLPALSIIIALGLQAFIQKFKTIALPLLFILISPFTISWFHEYLVHYPKEQSEYWQQGYQEAFQFIKDSQNNYQRIFINNSHEPALLHYLFWTSQKPAWFQQTFSGDGPDQPLYQDYSGFRLAEKIYFGQIETIYTQTWLEQNLSSQDLYLAVQGDEIPGDWDWSKSPPNGVKVLKTVSDAWGHPYLIWLTGSKDQ